MSNMVVFGNPGKINPKVWSVFGVSAKLDDNSIGRFGTGLKYAIAVLLREGRKIRIRSGEDVYDFTTKTINERGKEFQQVMCNNEEMPYTTHLGEGWDLWQAYRELYSNCLDEGGELGYKGEETLNKMLGVTVIEAEIGDVCHDEVFLNTKNLRCVAKSDYCEVYSKESKWVYYKGIRAMELKKKSKYTYNLLSADLTEDRTLKYHFQVDQGIASALMESSDSDFVSDFIFKTKDCFESTIDFDYHYGDISDMVIGIVSTNIKNNYWMQESLTKKIKEKVGVVSHNIVDPDEMQNKIIAKAEGMCEKFGYPVKYPVFVSDNLGRGVLAVADRKNNRIYLSTQLLTMGLKQVVSTLIEENIHIQYGFDDNTYEMQTWLFDQIVTLSEKLTGEIL